MRNSSTLSVHSLSLIPLSTQMGFRNVIFDWNGNNSVSHAFPQQKVCKLYFDVAQGCVNSATLFLRELIRFPTLKMTSCTFTLCKWGVISSFRTSVPVPTSSNYFQLRVCVTFEQQRHNNSAGVRRASILCIKVSLLAFV